jgi:Flp pilus assembly protein TadB
VSGSERLDPGPGVSLSTSGATSYDPNGGNHDHEVDNSTHRDIVGPLT